MNMAIQNNKPILRQKNRVLVILKKSKGDTNLAKLQTILLLEVDLNTVYKIIFSSRVLPVIEE